MSAYTRGKNAAIYWTAHWDLFSSRVSSRTTTEADLMEYAVSIRTAFTSSEPNVPIMSDRVKETHRVIMTLESEEVMQRKAKSGKPIQREMVLVWHLGDEKARREMFGDIRREPSKLKAIYEKIGRRLG